MNLSNKLKLGTHLRSFYQNIKRNYILCVSSAIINKSQNSVKKDFIYFILDSFNEKRKSTIYSQMVFPWGKNRKR